MTSTEPSEQFQIPIDAAELYESAFVPGFFAQWSPTLCEIAGVSTGNTVLDVACGTGIAARTAADLVGANGHVVGADLNPSMLTVAARVRPDIEWRQADAVALPFDDQQFDVVLCQMALMFMPDRESAVREMSRVVKAGGRIAVVVPGALAEQPAFEPFVELAARLCGPDAVSLLTTYFVCGDMAELELLFESAGLRVTDTRTVIGTYAAPSVDAAVTTEVESTPLVERISEATYQELRAGTRELWQGYVTPDGALAAPFGCHFIAGCAG
jgi:ubiquinone/menaquinone biosynthesis C-methylase UbiE